MIKNKKKSKMTWWNLLLLIVAMLISFFIVSSALGCLPFSPWVMANGGHTFMPWCAG